jgi:hypothetical protein
MIELKSKEQLNEAIERAKKSRLYVRASSFFRQYKVENRENDRIWLASPWPPPRACTS